MNYELCKELKAAGFPQQGNPWGREDKAYSPSLTELIEACGENLQTLTFLHDINAVDAYSEVINLTERAVTPEEAVARLWLALNKK